MWARMAPPGNWAVFEGMGELAAGPWRECGLWAEAGHGRGQELLEQKSYHLGGLRECNRKDRRLEKG